MLLASILHHFIPADITPLIARVRNALRPGGTVAIWDSESPPRGGPVGHGDVVSLFFRLDVECGRLPRNGLRELAARPTLLRRQKLALVEPLARPRARHWADIRCKTGLGVVVNGVWDSDASSPLSIGRPAFPGPSDRRWLGA